MKNFDQEYVDSVLQHCSLINNAIDSLEYEIKVLKDFMQLVPLYKERCEELAFAELDPMMIECLLEIKDNVESTEKKVLLIFKRYKAVN